MVYSARIVNYVGSTVMIWLAIRLFPSEKWLITITSLFPVLIQERASVSVEEISYSAVVLLLALCLHIRYLNTRMNKKQFIAVCILVLLVTSCKVVCFVSVLFVLLIPARAFTNKKKMWISRGAFILVSLFLAIGWVFIAGKYMSLTNGGSNSAEKVSYILLHPLKYIALVNSTVWDNLQNWVFTAVGSSLGYPMPYMVNSGVILLFILLSFYVLIKDGADKKIN